MTKRKKLEPAVRIDGGKRVDLKARKERRGLVVAPRALPKRDMWKERACEDREVKRLTGSDGGKEGARTQKVSGRGLGSRSLTIRSRPGTFEWRYGRRTQDALYHAGSHFAGLWEKAGIAIASSADFLRGTASGYKTGIPDSRAEAASTLSSAVREIGRIPAERMIDYCVLGHTAAEIAHKHQQRERDIAAVLHQDLRAVAFHFRFL